MRVFILIFIVLIGLLLSLGGCVSPQAEPWMFYQAHDPAHISAPAPFFLTLEEAQAFVNNMNKDSNTTYQLSFIAR